MRISVAEVVPLQVRARALAVASTLNFGINLIVTLINSPVAAASQGQSILFGVYAGMCLVALIFVRFLVPETKGRSLEDIDRMMRLPLRGAGESESAPPAPHSDPKQGKS